MVSRKYQKKNKKKTLKNNKKYEFVSVPSLSQKKIEGKYCSCLMKVRDQKINNPYGICTQAVYGSRNLERQKMVKCSPDYDFSKYNMKQLKNYAKEKKIRGYSKMNRKKLIGLLTKMFQK